jgi:hypothetical protein
MSRGIRLIVAIAVGVATGVVGQATAEADTYSQFGAGNAQSGQTTGVRSTVTQPQAQSDGYWRWYWPGVTLNNGDFLQGGYADPSGPSCGLQWFYWSFNSAGTPVQQLYGPCGLTGSHEFRIVKEGTSGAYYNFVFRIDGVQSASTLSAASWAYTNQIGIVTELFSSGTFTTTPFVPTVTYSPALQILQLRWCLRLGKCFHGTRVSRLRLPLSDSLCCEVNNICGSHICLRCWGNVSCQWNWTVVTRKGRGTQAEMTRHLRRPQATALLSLLILAGCSGTGRGATESQPRVSGSNVAGADAAPRSSSSGLPMPVPGPPERECRQPTSAEDLAVGATVIVDATVRGGKAVSDGVNGSVVPLDAVKVLWGSQESVPTSIVASNVSSSDAEMLLPPGRYILLLGSSTPGFYYLAQGREGVFVFTDPNGQTLTRLCTVYSPDGVARPAKRAPGSLSVAALMDMATTAAQGATNADIPPAPSK